MSKLTAFFAVWAVAATVALAWVGGRNSVSPPPSGYSSSPPTTSKSLPILSPPALTPSPAPPASATPTFPQFVSTVPKAFRGSWDEMIADKCEGREARFYFGDRQFNNFEVAWEVTKVKLYSPTEMDMSTTTKSDDGDQVDQVWQFMLVDGGKTLTGRRKGAEFYKRCPVG